MDAWGLLNQIWLIIDWSGTCKPAHWVTEISTSIFLPQSVFLYPSASSCNRRHPAQSSLELEPMTLWLQQPQTKSAGHSTEKPRLAVNWLGWEGGLPMFYTPSKASWHRYTHPPEPPSRPRSRHHCNKGRPAHPSWHPLHFHEPVALADFCVSVPWLFSFSNRGRSRVINKNTLWVFPLMFSHSWGITSAAMPGFPTGSLLLIPGVAQTSTCNQ